MNVTLVCQGYSGISVAVCDRSCFNMVFYTTPAAAAAPAAVGAEVGL